LPVRLQVEARSDPNRIPLLLNVPRAVDFQFLPNLVPAGLLPASYSMIPKSGFRFSEKIMLTQ
jgi:hypothetical protein